MRRYPVVIGVTAAGLAGVFAYHTHGAAALGPSSPAAVATGPAGGSQAPRGGRAPTTTTGAGAPGGGSSPTTPTTTTPTTTAPTTTAPATVSATGTAEQYGYGVLSVRVTATGAKLSALSVVTLQTAEAYSQQLAQAVIPMLRREVLAAQSARIAAISGATYTSEAYAASVQSALDKLHRK